MVNIDLITQAPMTHPTYEATAMLVNKMTKVVHQAATNTMVQAPQFAKLDFSYVACLDGV